MTRIFLWLVLSPRIKSSVWIRPLRAFMLPSCPVLTSVSTQFTAPSLRSVPAPADFSHAPRLLLLVAEVPAQIQLCTWRLWRPSSQATFCVPRESCTYWFPAVNSRVSPLSTSVQRWITNTLRTETSTVYSRGSHTISDTGIAH